MSGSNTVEKFPVLITTCLVSSIGAMSFNAMPVLLGGLAETRALNESELSAIASAIFFGSLIAVFSAVYWVNRLSWRLVIIVMAIATILISAFLPFIAGQIQLTMLLALLGFVMGALYSPALAALSLSRTPERAFAIAIALQVAVSALVAYSLPVFLTPALGLWAIPCVLMITSILVLLCISWLPERSSDPVEATESDVKAPRKQVLTGILGLMAMCVFYIGLIGAWEFLERIGNSWSLSHEYIGGIIALALIVGAGGALFPMVLGDRFGKVRPVILAIVLLLAAAILLSVQGTALRFAAGAILLNVGWNLAIPFMYASLADADPSGRFVVFSVSIQMAGAVIGAGIAGALVVGVGFSGLFTFFGGCVLMALAIHTLVVRRLMASSSNSVGEID